MGIIVEDIARVREATDFAGVVGEQVALRRQGTKLVGLCPFHAEKTPSFSVNPTQGLYYCFGCQASGDAITFVRETQHLDFAGAVEWLAARVGITLHYDEARPSAETGQRTALLDAMERAQEWYHERLRTAPDAGPARSYLRDRGFDAATVTQFRLGWAPDEWDALCRALSVPSDVLSGAGLGFVNRAGRQQDAFRARIMFPIFDVAGHTVAFGGRVLPGGAGPKYKNSPETLIYSKRRTLYGLNWAKADVVHAGEVIVCEGYTDVIAFFRAGLPRAVATCGTALADEHFGTLKNFARRIVLAYDADTAGQGAAERFYTWERRFDVELAVVELPEGSDPDDLARRSPDSLGAAVQAARPFLGFRIDRVMAGADLRSPEGRARAAEQALALIAEHPNDLVRDSYLMRVADRCQLDPDRLRSRLAGQASGDRGRERAGRSGARRLVDPGGEGAGGSGAGRIGRAVPSAGPELEALRLAVHRPETVAAFLEDVLFRDETYRKAFEVLAGTETLHDAIEIAEPGVAALLRRVAVEDCDAEPDDIVALLVRRATLRELDRLEAQARATGEVIDLSWPKLRVEDLDRPDTRVEATAQLVAWVTRVAKEGE